jgi:hypothetical protein
MDRRTFGKISVMGLGSSLLLHGNSRAEEASHAPAPCAELPELPRPVQPGVEERFFPGFQAHSVQTSGAKIHVLKGGSRAPLLLRGPEASQHMSLVPVGRN